MTASICSELIIGRATFSSNMDQKAASICSESGNFHLQFASFEGAGPWISADALDSWMSSQPGGQNLLVAARASPRLVDVARDPRAAFPHGGLEKTNHRPPSPEASGREVLHIDAAG